MAKKIISGWVARELNGIMNFYTAEPKWDKKFEAWVPEKPAERIGHNILNETLNNVIDVPVGEIRKVECWIEVEPLKVGLSKCFCGGEVIIVNVNLGSLGTRYNINCEGECGGIWDWRMERPHLIRKRWNEYRNSVNK